MMFVKYIQSILFVFYERLVKHQENKLVQLFKIKNKENKLYVIISQIQIYIYLSNKLKCTNHSSASIQ